MTIVLVGILAMAVIPVISSGIKTYVTTTTSINTLSKLRFATERMAREIREVRRNPAALTNYQMTMGANTLVFTKTDGNQVTITSGVPNVTLTYQTPAVTAVLTNQVNAVGDLTFKYYLADGINETTSLALVTFVEIYLTLTEDGAPVRQVTRAALRNQR